MPEYVMGRPYPEPFGEHMRAHLYLEGARLALMLQLVVPGPTPDELRAMLGGPIRLAVTPSPPLAWIVLEAEGLPYDAPYAIGIEGGRAPALRAALEGWAEPAGPRTVELDCIDGATGTFLGTRLLSVSGGWAAAFAGSVLSCPARISGGGYRAAMRRDQSRWPGPAEVLRAARASELGAPVTAGTAGFVRVARLSFG